MASDIYRHYDLEAQPIDAEGRFRFDAVPAERWAVVVTEGDPDAPDRAGEAAFRIDLMPDGVSDEPQDIGEVAITARHRVRRRKIAPRPARAVPPEDLRPEDMKWFKPTN